MHIQLSADPSLVWISEVSDTRELASEALQRVISWLKVASRSHVQLNIDSSAVLELYENALIPSENHISGIVSKAGFDGVVSSQDIAKLINEVVIASCDSSSTIQKIADFTRLELDFSATISDLSKQNLSKEAFLNFCLVWGTSNVDSSYVFPRISQESIITKNEIRIETFETDQSRVFDGSDVGLKVPVYGKVSGLYASLDPDNIWKSASDTVALEEAIKSLASQSAIEHTELKSYSFGSSFLDTADKCGGISGAIHSVLMRKIFEIVTGSEAVTIADFRTSEKQSSPVRVRSKDKAEARRVHLTKRNEAYRLMFWELKDGSIEFANVGTKFENKIC